MPTFSLSLLSAAALCWLLAPLVAWGRRPHLRDILCSGLLGLGALALLAAVVVSVPHAGFIWPLPLPLFLGSAPFALAFDALTAWFLGIIALASTPLALYLPGYLRHLRHHADLRLFWGAMSLLLLSMSLVILAANALTFLLAWELMSLSSFLLVATTHQEISTRRAALIYLGATRIGTAFLAGAFLWTHVLTGSWTFTDWHLTGSAALGPGLLLLIGLGVKAGMWPFHLWLPIAHPAAPSPVSALMSGVMVKVAVYMLIRLLILPAAFSHPAFGYILLALGALAAFWGVMFALVQADLKRLLAYSTVENIGIILLGLGVSLVTRDLGVATVARIALAAALFHALNHALFKSLLFLSVGAVDMAVGTRNLERLGGLGQRMPGTFASFLLGSATLCALPPFNGFASEWLLYQSLLGLAASQGAPVLRFLAMLLVGWLALVGALALACFLKAIGVGFLGRPRSPQAERATTIPTGMLGAQGIFGVSCVAFGVLTPIVLRHLHPLVAPLEPGGVALETIWTIPTAALVIILGVTIACLALLLRLAARHQPVRLFLTWECGFGDLTARMQTTSRSFSQPLAYLFGSLLRYALRLHIQGPQRRLFPEELRVQPHTEGTLVARFYGPFMRAVNRAGSWVLRLQTGSIHLYLLTMFATLVVLLALGGYVR